MWSLLRWLDMTRIYIQKVHLTACTDRSGDQTHWLNLQSITQLLGHVRTFRHQQKETKLKCCERKHVNRNILYLVAVCSLETTNQFQAFFVCSFILKYYDPPCFMFLTMYLCTHVCILLYMGLNITWAPCFYEVWK